MLPALKYIVALAIAGLLAGCGGGEAPTLSPERIAKAAQSPMASVTPSAAAELLLNAAEAAYPGLFVGHQATQTFGEFTFRHYPQTGMYLGVVTSASAHYNLNGVYVVGGGFGTLANPGYQGQITSFINVDIGGGTTTGHTLVVTATVMGHSSTVTLYNVPAPTTESFFCDGLATDTTFTSYAAQGGGSMTIDSCSFNGTTGHIAATLSVSYPGYPPQTISYTITYTYT